MINIIWIWLSTIIVSLSIELHIGIDFIKEIVKNGYKLKSNELQNLQNNLIPEEKQKSILISTIFLPIYNIFLNLMMKKSYEENKEQMIRQYIDLKVAEPLNDVELKEYEKNKGTFNSLVIGSGVYSEYNNDNENLRYIKFEEEGKCIEIYYIFENGKVKDIKSYGDKSLLNIEKIADITAKNIVRESFDSIMDRLEKSIENKDDEFEKLNLSKEEKIKILKEYKEIVNEKYEKMDDKDNNDDMMNGRVNIKK